ncbi:acyl-CoA thioesterase [Stieleria sp. TO1_6]|uniref:acyl-CoA thioesterase n=1 Tax=Stieleria tagensis TaxID=2956795 RepID=UPI00209B76E7|nr:acyl-CoA thioesterase [Stieleria tagensis]MCO8125064.1 acyl-CoA thioesterase [Stieleria tagensis]
MSQITDAPSAGDPDRYFDFHHTVADQEIDAQQHVHNLRYLQWTLWAAGRHTDASGWDTKAALERGLGWVVREHSIQYRSAAVAGDEIVVRTWVHDLQRFSSRRKYLICRPADQSVLARVETRWVFVDLRQHKALEIPVAAQRLIVVCDTPPPLPWQ